MNMSRVRHIIREINISNFRKTLDCLKQYGLRDTAYRLKEALFKPTPDTVVEMEELVDHYTSLKMEKGVCNYPSSEQPLVSIIIPVYNHCKMTYDCIRSIIDSDLCVPTELIIADDCSPEGYEDFQEYIQGVAVCRSDSNQGFTLNCNNAAKQARGKYLFFLNNDTVVTSNWLSPLIELMESHPEIGLAGSKLLFPDGTLQEAGGILWKDGSAWNYGRDKDPNASEYCYVHDVDYISGAAIMVRRELFERLGGFDPRYAPAYCEDSDLAFGIRDLGYRTVLQPFSIIFHFEGMSNGKRVDVGLKKYQLVNKEKFLEKWKDVLERESYEVGKNLFHARDRSARKTTILFVEEMIPHYDDNAGHRTVYDYLKTLADMGYNVKYLPNNFYYDANYVPVYQKMGIEVLYGKNYWDNWEKWISDNGSFFDIVMIYRPDIAARYLKTIRKNTNAKIIYNVADLHYVRLAKEYEITGDGSKLRESKAMKKRELSYMHAADYTGTVSCEEAEIISKEIGIDKTILFPIYCFDETDSGKHDYVAAKDLMFVGGFSHRPNGDAVTWFVRDVLSTVMTRYPDVRLHVIGSNPPKEVTELASDNVIIEGRVSDEALDRFYRDSAVCVIPLRYGAGVKGKFVEALRMKVPIVTTSIGMEGLEGIDEYVTPFDNASDFAAEVIRLLNDRVAAEHETERHMEYVDMHFTRESMRRQFIEVFGPPVVE